MPLLMHREAFFFFFSYQFEIIHLGNPGATAVNALFLCVTLCNYQNVQLQFSSGKIQSVTPSTKKSLSPREKEAAGEGTRGREEEGKGEGREEEKAGEGFPVRAARERPEFLE